MDVQRNKSAYITGSSKGIGKALVELLLKKGYHVIGLSRSNDLQTDHYSFISIDLSDLQAVKKFRFTKSANEVLLVNNAGSLGEVAPLGSVKDDAIINVMNVNSLAPQILMNKFIAEYGNKKGTYHILNISSGAGKRPIPSWSAYCASKAAIDLFSETVAEELKWEEKENWYIHSCAPGVVDTEMQSKIRSTSEDKFRDISRFKQLKENDELASPETVAEKLYRVIDHPSSFPEVLISVRDF